MVTWPESSVHTQPLDKSPEDRLFHLHTLALVLNLSLSRLHSVIQKAIEAERGREQLHCVKRFKRRRREQEKRRQREIWTHKPVKSPCRNTHTSFSISCPPLSYTQRTAKSHAKVQHREKEKEREQSLSNTGHWVQYSNIIVFSIYISIYIYHIYNISIKNISYSFYVQRR